MAGFERLLFGGIDAVTEIPDTRWAKYRYFHPDRDQPGKTYTFAAGVLGDVDTFDAAFFGISPREAAQMDPQQRLMLELAHEAMEDAGLDGATVAGTVTGVYVGGSSWDYLTLHTGDPAIMDAYSMTGATLCSLSNRVSFAFDLRGPSLTIDTACSSSLVALHHACEAIRSGQVPLAMVGGVSLLLAPHSFVGFSAASMLSPRGRCHAFDARADGYVRAEGGAMIVLRPLGEALARGDAIRAVIRGTGVNSDGRTTGFSLPNKVAQADLLRAVYGRFHLDPRDLCYVEAHGTGTPAGDPIEAGALGEVLGRDRADPLPIGSVKTNVGHLEAASGMAGLLKAMVVLNRGVVPASLHCETPNPAIPFAKLNLQLTPDELPIETTGRLVGVNSFGFGGANAHAVLEAFDQPEASQSGSETLEAPLLLSARSEPALRNLAATWRDNLAADQVDTALLRAAALAREMHRHRLVVNSASAAGMAAGLTDWLDDRANYAVAAGEAVAGKVAFVFSGNGSQWSGMGEAAARYNAPFRHALAEVDAALLPLLDWSVAERLVEPGGWEVKDTSVAQPLLFAVQVATVQALRHAGIHADLFLGHSVGEVAAAWAAGALRLEQACQVIAARSRLQALTAGSGRMGVLALPAAQVDKALAGTKLEVAAWNTAAIVTVAGPSEDIDRLAARAEQEHWAFTPIDLDYAFHTASMDPLKAPLLVNLVKLRPPPCPASFLSTVSGGKMPGRTRLDADYWWRNVREPVRFADAAAEAVARGARILIEVGPQPVLQSYLTDALVSADATGRALPTFARRTPKHRDPVAMIAARCHAAGCDMRGAAVFAGPRDHRGLPPYPWQRQPYPLGMTSESLDVATIPSEHPLLGARQNRAEALEWSNQLGPALQPWLAGHVVGGAIVAPAALLIELALAAAKSRYPSAAALQILDFEIARPLTFEPGILRDVRLRVNEGTAQFQIASRTRLSGDPWTVHAAGQLARADTELVARPIPPPVLGGQATDSATLYARAAELGLNYKAAFQVVTGVVAQGLDRADVTLAPPAGSPVLPAGLLLPPTLLDGAFQGLVALASGLLTGSDGVVPWRFGRARLLRPAGAQPHSARLTVTRVGPRSVRADIHLLDASGAAVAELTDCWFVRVQIGAGAARPESWIYHVAAIASAGRNGGLAAGELLGLAGEAAHETEPDDAALLADGFAGYAVAEAFRAALPEPDASFTIAELISAGQVSSIRRERCAELLGWLQSDGLATAEDGRWRLTGLDDVPTDEILRTLVFETQGTVADAALLSAATQTLATCLGDGHGAGPLPEAALADHLLHASPAGHAISRALAKCLVRVAQAWPEGQPLRVLHVGARRGVVSRQLLRALGPAGRAVQFHALTAAADQSALADALRGFPGAVAETWTLDAPVPDARPFDVVIGSGALTLGSAEIAGLLGHAAGGLLILAEPGPSRVWSLVWPDAARGLRDGAAWVEALSQAGVVAARWLPVAGGWGAGVLAGRVVPAQPVVQRSEGLSVTLIAASDSLLADAIASALDTPVELLRPDEADAALATWRAQSSGTPNRIVLVPEPGDPVAPWLDRLARLAEAAPGPARLTVVAREGPLAAALGGLRRVIANELPDSVCRHVVLAAELSVAEAAAHAAFEILQPDGEPEIAWSARGRTAPRLRTGLPASPKCEAGTPLRLAVGRPGLLDTVGWDEAEALPPPGQGELAIHVRASGLNFRDVMWAMGMLPDEALLDGFAGPTLGLECAGEVTAVGPGVTGFVPGDRVMAFAPASLASHAVTAAHAVVRIPDQLGFAAAATIPVAFLTVAYSLGYLARLEAGERVLVHGGAGGVGLAAIQYAKQRGAVVFATAGTPAKRAMLRRLGVDAVFDSRTLGFADDIMRLTGGEGVDVVLNSLSGDAMEASLKLLRPYGRFLELGKRDFYGNTRVGLRPFRHNVAYFGVDVDQLPLRQPKLAAALLAEIAGMLTEGLLRPLPFRSFDASDAPEAFRLMQASGHIGKIVLEFGQPIEARRPLPATVPAVRGDRQYVVTGGLAGFGLQAAKWLAGQGARHLALLSRRGDSAPGAAAALDQLRALGAEASAYACDVADEAALASVLEIVRQAGPPLGGVIHAAVVMDDGLLPGIDQGRFARALRPKLDGTAALDRLTRRDPIGLFIVFSSVTTVLGNPGQANYVASNAAAEAVVEARCREGLPGLAVQWGPIGDAGYLTREAAVADLLSKRLGERLMTAAEALSSLPALIGSGLPVIGLARMRWGQLGAGLPLLQTPMFDAVRGNPAESAGATDLAAMLASCTPEEAQARLSDMLADEVARIMRMPSGSIPRHRPLAELGMDSLMAVELRMAVEQRFGLTLPVMALSDGVTLTALAGRMARASSGAGPGREDELQVMAERISRYEQVEAGEAEPVAEPAVQS